MDAFTAALIEAQENDREEAHDATCEAFHALEALQATDTWQELPLVARQALCAAHATLGAIANGLAGE